MIFCCRCHRLIRASAVQIQDVGGAYGPRCARIKGYIPAPKPRMFTVLLRRKAVIDSRQLEIPA